MGRSSVIVTITLIFGPSTLSTQNVGQLDIKNVENVVRMLGLHGRLC